MKIKGSYLIVGSILLLFSKVALSNLFPTSLVIQAIAVVIELSWWIILIIGIVVALRERKAKKEAKNYPEK